MCFPQTTKPLWLITKAMSTPFVANLALISTRTKSCFGGTEFKSAGTEFQQTGGTDFLLVRQNE